MFKSIIYLDADTAISCLMRSLCSVGLCKQADQLLGLTISSPDGVRHAQRVIAGLPMNVTTEKARRGALEMLSFASTQPLKMAVVQAPIDF